MSEREALNQVMLNALLTRRERNLSRIQQDRKTQFGYGIRTAADYVGGVLECLDDDLCRAIKLGSGTCPTFDATATLKEAAARLTYSNDEMTHDTPLTSACDIDDYCKAHRVKRPPYTLMVMEFVVTTPKKDRDGDILRTDGAQLDPASPGLWQHMSAMPLGRTLRTVVQNSKRLKIAGSIIDSQLGADTALLVDHGALRISHGFRPLKFEKLEGEDEHGFDVKEFEVMEWSVVSVPSNTDAVITAFSRGKLTDPLVKRWAGRQLAGRTLTLNVPVEIECDGNEWHVVRAAAPANDPFELLASVPLIKTAEPEREAPDVKDDPIRWNCSLSKNFDVASEHLEASRLEYEWVSRFVGCQIKQVFKTWTMVPSSRMGSFLTAVRDTTQDWRKDDERNITPEGQEEPPVYEVIQLNSRLSDDFLIEGMSFFRMPSGCKLVVKRTPFWGGLYVTVYSSHEHKEQARAFIRDTWERSKQYKFLKGEAFSLSGEFLAATDETWANVYLPKRNAQPLQRVVDVLNQKQERAPNRGVILMGPPGTGKTLSGRVIRNTIDGTFIWVSARDFYRAGVFRGITLAFELAKELAPAVVFIEDIDHYLHDTAIDLLKTEMDGIGQSQGVITVLTTNYPERLPKALIDRPGRFHDVLKLDLPDEQIRTQMLRAWLPEVEPKELQFAVKETEGYSGAHLYELAQYAKSIAEEDELPLVEAVKAALAKIHEQRELINEVQLGDSKHHLRRDLTLQPIKESSSDETAGKAEPRRDAVDLTASALIEALPHAEPQHLRQLKRAQASLQDAIARAKRAKRDAKIRSIVSRFKR